jgi:ABC-type molybdate transport system substrate-binding protein
VGARQRYNSAVRRPLLAVCLLAACGKEPTPREPITVHAAASLARPMRALADSFRVTTGIPLRIEYGGSLELSRRTTDLGTPPDVLLLADDEVMAALLPAHFSWYVRFATSRLVVAYGGRSRRADSISTESWWRVLSADGVTVGRADSAIAPAGRHALGVLRRAEGYYGERGLTARLLARAGPAYIRPNATELAALLAAGEVDFILEYESVARQLGFRYVSLPTDLAPAVLYGAAVPRASARQADAERFVAFLLGDDGARIMRASHVDMLRMPVALGRDIPAGISALTRTVVER